VILDGAGNTGTVACTAMSVAAPNTPASGVLTSTGTTVGSVGEAVSSGVRQLGKSQDPISDTLGGVPVVVDNTGKTVSRAGQSVNQTGTGIGGLAIPLDQVVDGGAIR